MTMDVLMEFLQERRRQDERFGEQNIPNGVYDSYTMREKAATAREECDYATAKGFVTWAHVLTEEFYEALAESEPGKLRAELVQLGAVCCAFIECIDRRNKP